MKVNVAGEGLTPRLPARSTCFKCKYPSIQASSGPFCCPRQSSGTGPSLHSYLHCCCRLIPQGSWAAGPLSPQPSSKPGQERSCKVFCPPESNSEPITHNLFIFLLHHLCQYSSLCPQDRLMLAAAFSLAFHGFLRVGEYTVPSLRRFNPSHHATVHDIIWHKHHLSFTIKRSKTDQLANWAEAPPFPSRNHPGPVHSAPIVPSIDMSEGFPALTHALHHSFASVMAHLCLAQPAINSSAICSPKRGI